MEKEEKQRISLYLDQKLVREGDRLMEEMGFRSRNEFYSFLLKERLAGEFLSYHETEVGREVSRAIASLSTRNASAISRGLFRYAVELETAMRLMCREKGISRETYDQLRREAVQHVKWTEGKVDLKEVLDLKF